MTDVVHVDELPIGVGQRRLTKESAERDGGDVDDALADGRVVTPPAPALSLVTPPTEQESAEQLALWEPAKMRRPLQIVVGKTVNWRMRKATGIETTAGLMSDEQADNINEPLSEIFNRFEPMRAIAAKQTEIALGIAIYDYVQATVVQAGRDVQALEDAHRQVRVVDAAAPTPLFPQAPPAAEHERVMTHDPTEDEL